MAINWKYIKGMTNSCTSWIEFSNEEYDSEIFRLTKYCNDEKKDKKVYKDPSINEIILKQIKQDKEDELMVGSLEMEDVKNYYVDLGRARGILPNSEPIAKPKVSDTIPSQA